MTRIEWTDETWNPVIGCSKVSQGCKHCYAERMFSRVYGRDRVPLGFVGPGGEPSSRPRMFTDVTLHPGRLDMPLRWKRPRRIFVNSMSDLFHADVSDEFIAAVFGVMAAAPHHTFQVLTKRPERMLAFLAGETKPSHGSMREWCYYSARDLVGKDRLAGRNPWNHVFPLLNVWLGVSVEDQATADERIPLLLQTPAAVRWLSCEPLLGSVDLSAEYLATKCGGIYPFKMLPDQHRTKIIDLLDWVVVGGESGQNARPMLVAWARSIRDQCASAGVSFFFKQFGEFAPEDKAPGAHTAMRRVGKARAGRELDGRTHDGMP